jgi:NAD/NADP transhydrogenase beta subunit
MVNPRYWACTALAAVVVFLILLAALHFLEPEFDPSKRLISEYELGRYGWIMSLAFFSLGVGVLATMRSTGKASTGTRGRIGRWWFLAISIAFFGAAIFYPYRPPNFASYIHGLCGMIVIVTFPIAATLCASGLAHNQAWTALRRQLRWATVLVWVGLLLFAGSVIVFGIISQPVDRSNPNLLVGWQNRFMIVTYSIWLIIVVWSVAFPKKVQHRNLHQ